MLVSNYELSMDERTYKRFSYQWVKRPLTVGRANYKNISSYELSISERTFSRVG
jgi:hypothetical protein